jgi:pimeloyl-ACP methyl ester carboxylesterase
LDGFALFFCYDVVMKSVVINCLRYSIDADLYEASADKVLLVLHGWSSNKKSQEALTSFLVKETGASALVIEYSGHGDSPFDAMETRPAQHFLEVITAFDWLRQTYPNAEISVMGTSYGGYLAVQLTKYRDFENLILRVPAIYTPRDFYSLNKDIDRQHERRYREDKEFLDSHPLLARASKFKGRTLVVWHEFDEYVPKETTDKYIEVFHADSYFAKGWHHSFKIDAPEEEQAAYKNAIRDWLINNSSSSAR